MDAVLLAGCLERGKRTEDVLGSQPHAGPRTVRGTARTLRKGLGSRTWT